MASFVNSAALKSAILFESECQALASRACSCCRSCCRRTVLSVRPSEFAIRIRQRPQHFFFTAPRGAFFFFFRGKFNSAGAPPAAVLLSICEKKKSSSVQGIFEGEANIKTHTKRKIAHINIVFLLQLFFLAAYS